MKHHGNPQTNCNIIIEPRSVLGSFGVVLEMSYKVNFHVVGSALKNSKCLLVFEPQNETGLTGGQDLLDLSNMSFKYKKADNVKRSSFIAFFSFPHQNLTCVTDRLKIRL